MLILPALIHVPLETRRDNTILLPIIFLSPGGWKGQRISKRVWYIYHDLYNKGNTCWRTTRRIARKMHGARKQPVI